MSVGSHNPLTELPPLRAMCFLIDSLSGFYPSGTVCLMRIELACRGEDPSIGRRVCVLETRPTSASRHHRTGFPRPSGPFTWLPRWERGDRHVNDISDLLSNRELNSGQINDLLELLERRLASIPGNRFHVAPTELSTLLLYSHTNHAAIEYQKQFSQRLVEVLVQ